MDFHNMKRKELQKLCKNHNIPANLSNLEMVDKLSSLFKVQEGGKEKPVRKTRSCLKNSDEMLSENESDVLKKNLKKVRFSPENDVFQLGEKSERGSVVENKGGAGRVTRGRASLLCKTVLISPVVMKRKGKRAGKEVEEDLVVENQGGASRVTRARASLGKNVVISSPVVMKRRAKRAVQEVEKKDLDVESKGGVGRVTRAQELADEKILIPSPVVMKKRGKKAVQKDEKGESVFENQGGTSRITRARAGKQVLIPSPVAMKKRGKQAVQEDEKGDLVVENKGVASRVTRARAGKQVLISSPAVMKKKGKRAVQEEKKSGSAQFLVVDFTNPGVEEENEVITVKFLRNRKVESVVSPKNFVRKRNTQKRSQTINAEVSENKDVEADGDIPQPKMGLRRSTRNVNISEESEGLMDETDQKVSRKNYRQSSRQRPSAKSSVEDVDKKTVAVEISQPEVVTRQSKRNRQLTDESTIYQTRRGTKRMSVIPQTKKAKTEKPVAGNLGKKHIVVKDSPNESTKPVVVEKGSETGHIRRSKRNASGDGSPVIAEDADGSRTSIETSSTKKRRRDAVLEEVPSQQTGRRVNRKADNISDKLVEETPVASEPRTRSGNRQASLLHSAKKLNVSGNLLLNRTAGEKASPHHTRELSTVPKRSATGARQLKTVAVTPRTRSGSVQKSFIHTTKKIRKSSNSGLHIGDKGSPHHSREILTVPRRSETESKGKGLKSKHTPVIREHSRRFTRSALKGKTDGPAYVRGKIHQKKPQSVSKLPLSKVVSSLPKATSEGPLDFDVQSSGQEVDRSTVNLISNASDLPEDKTACSTPQAGSSKTSSVDLTVQKSDFPEMINVHEVSPSEPLNLQSNHADLEVNITPQGGSQKTSSVDLNVQESEGPELTNMSEASPSDPSNLQSNHAELEVNITPQGGSPKTSSVDLYVQESEGPELTNMCEASPSDPLNLQSNHAELEVNITPQGGSPKTSSVDLNVQASEDPELKNMCEASPSDPLSLQINHAALEVNITSQGGSPKTSSVDLNVQESDGPELTNMCEASPSDPLNLQSNHAEIEVDISTPQGGSPKTSSADLNVQESDGPELTNMCEASPSDPLNLQSNHAEIEVDISTPQGGSPKTNIVDLNLRESEGPELIDIHQALASDPLNLQSNLAEVEVDIPTPQGSSLKTSSVDLNVQESEGPELITIRELSPGDPLNVQRNHAELEVDISTPQKGSPETGSVDLNVQESEGPELISIREASPFDTLNLQSNHAVPGDDEDNTTATQRENSCETNVASPHLVHLEADAAAGDVFPVDTNALVDISFVEQSTSTRTEERPRQSNDVESISEGIDLNLVFQGPAVHADKPVYQSPLPEVAEIDDNSAGKSDAACVTQQGPTEIDAKSPPLDHLKSADNIDIIGDAGSIDTGSVEDYHLNAERINSSAIKEKQEVSKNVYHVVAGESTVNEEKPTAEVGDCGPTEQEHDIRKHPTEFLESGQLDKDFESVSKEVGDAVGYADNYYQNVSMNFTVEKDEKMHPEISMHADEPPNTSSKSGMQEKAVPNSIANTEEVSIAIKEKQEVSKNVYHVVAGESTVNEEKPTAEVGDCGPTEQEHDIRKHPTEFLESGQLDKDFKSVSKEVGDAVGYADNYYQNVSMNFTVEKDEKMHPEISMHADEPPNTSSKSGMQEKAVPNSIANTEEVSILEYDFSKPEFSDIVTSTVMCSNKELEEDSNQRLSTVESCLMREESCTNICIEFSTSNVVADSVSGENSKSQPTAPSSPLHATKFDNIVIETNEDLKPEDSALSWSTDIFERAAVDGSSLQEERNSAKSVDVSEQNHLKNAEVKYENRKRVGTFDILTSEMSDMPEFTPSLPSHVTELGHLVEEVKELNPEDSSSLWSTENVPKRTAEDGNSFHKQVGIRGREVVETVFEDTVENASERTSSMFGDAHHILDGQLPTEREWDLEEMMCSISGAVEERRMDKNISRENTPVISEDDIDRDNNSCPVIVHEFPSIVDHCHTPVEDSCGKEKGTDMSMVKSIKKFNKELSSQHDYCHGSLDSCGEEQGTPMSIVKSNVNCVEEFSSQHDKSIKQVKVCSAAALPQTIFEDFTGFDNEMVADVERISKKGGLNNEKFEETEPCTVINDKIILEDGIELFKRNSSNLTRNLVEDGGSYSEDSLQQFDVNCGESDSKLKGICQENDERPYQVQMDVDTNNVESSRDNLIAGNTVHRFDQEADASGVPTEHPGYEDAIYTDVPANLQYGGDSVTLPGQTNEARAGVPTEGLTRIEDAMDADAPANLQYGRQSLTITGETNQAQAERSPEGISFCSDFFGSDLKSKSDEVGVDREESHSWFEDTNYMLEKGEDDIFMVSATKEQLHDSGEEHVRVGNHNDNPSTGDDNVSVENSGGTLSESQLESEANKDAHQKVDCYDNNKSDEDFTRTIS